MYQVVKRFADVVFASIGLVFLIPATIFVKLAYLISGDFHKIIYSQIRIGKDGKEFKMYKYRTMVPDADEMLKKLLKNPKYKKEWKKYHKLDNDPRITKIGRFIRYCSIDELPQIINVLSGDLSIIGPRPLIPGEIEGYRGKKTLYESIRPGITGWWAVNGRSDINAKKRMALEYYYIDNFNALLDMEIFFKTIGAVFSHKGAK